MVSNMAYSHSFDGFHFNMQLAYIGITLLQVCNLLGTQNGDPLLDERATRQKGKRRKYNKYIDICRA